MNCPFGFKLITHFLLGAGGVNAAASRSLFFQDHQVPHLKQMPEYERLLDWARKHLQDDIPMDLNGGACPDQGIFANQSYDSRALFLE
jgi:hypothetical protein